MSRATARYRSAVRRFNSPPLSKKQRDNSPERNASTADYKGYNPDTGEHEVSTPDGEVLPIDTPQNKPMGVGDQGYQEQGYFVL